MELDELLAVLNSDNTKDEGGELEDDEKRSSKEGETGETAATGEDKKGEEMNAQQSQQKDTAQGNQTQEQVNVAAQLAGTLDSVQFNSMIQGEIDRFFRSNPEINDPLLKNRIISLAISKAKQGFASGQVKPMYDMLDAASEDVKEELVKMLNVGATVLRELAIKKGKDKRGEFWKKASQYSMEDYFKDYYKNILPSMTVKGMEVVRLEKGYGQDKEEYYGGKAPHFKGIDKAV